MDMVGPTRASGEIYVSSLVENCNGDGARSVSQGSLEITIGHVLCVWLNLNGDRRSDVTVVDIWIEFHETKREILSEASQK